MLYLTWVLPILQIFVEDRTGLSSNKSKGLWATTSRKIWDLVLPSFVGVGFLALSLHFFVCNGVWYLWSTDETASLSPLLGLHIIGAGIWIAISFVQLSMASAYLHRMFGYVGTSSCLLMSVTGFLLPLFNLAEANAKGDSQSAIRIGTFHLCLHAISNMTASQLVVQLLVDFILAAKRRDFTRHKKIFMELQRMLLMNLIQPRVIATVLRYFFPIFSGESIFSGS